MTFVYRPGCDKIDECHANADYSIDELKEAITL